MEWWRGSAGEIVESAIRGAMKESACVFGQRKHLQETNALNLLREKELRGLGRRGKQLDRDKTTRSEAGTYKADNTGTGTGTGSGTEARLVNRVISEEQDPGAKKLWSPAGIDIMLNDINSNFRTNLDFGGAFHPIFFFPSHLLHDIGRTFG
jgi:hypothetical protein